MKIFLLFFLLFSSLIAEVKPGVDVLFEKYSSLLNGRRIGLITNQTAINSDFALSIDLFRQRTKLVALFAPEHGLFGAEYAEKNIDHSSIKGIPVYSLHGKTRRPTKEMLTNIDLLVFDIQDLGSRSYTYLSTLFYCMEEAAKNHIPIVVCDRPNPLGGYVVDGPLIEEKWRSFIGYINIPYCHGMTVGELALLFNEEYKIGADVTVIPMEGWKRRMIFHETGLKWVPASPQIPEDDTPFFYPATGLIGHLSLANIGIGYTLPFKIVGAPWMDGEKIAAKLNELNLKGVIFQPFYFRPFFGKFKGENCKGVRLIVTDHSAFKPFTTQYCILGVLKALYPGKFKEALDELMKSSLKKEIFNKLNGSEEILTILQNDKFFIWKLREKFQKQAASFLPIREKYLNPQYR